MNRAKLGAALEKHWRRPKFWGQLLLQPFSAIYYFLSTFRRALYQAGLLPRHKPPLPVVVVGNLHVGGTGKTPQVIALATRLQDAGLKVGVISRGYGRQSTEPLLVDPKHPDFTLYGDEASLIAQKAGVPVAVAKKRLQAIELLRGAYPDLEIIISDDGLQHYALDPTLKIAVFPQRDLKRRLFLLPNGPLREPLTRLKEMDGIIITGAPLENPPPALLRERLGEVSGKIIYSVNTYGALYPLGHPEDAVAHDFFSGGTIAAAAAIANPERFFTGLERLGIKLAARIIYPDHALLPAAQLAKKFDYVIITEKDAVKLQGVKSENIYVLPLAVSWQGEVDSLLSQIKKLARPAYLENKPS